MQAIFRIAILVAVGWQLLEAQAPRAAEVQFKAAQHKEEVEGDLKGAIEQYKRVAQSADRALAAKALVRIGNCYEKLGNAEAISMYERVVREFADQEREASEAKSRIAKLGAARTASPGGVILRQLPFSPESTWIHADGRHIAYIRSGTGEIVVTDMDGRHSRVVSGGRDSGATRRVFSPVLPPDGKHVAYLAYADPEHHQSELVFQSVAGGEAHTLLKTKAGDSLEIHDFTSDSRRVLIIVKNNQSGIDSLCLVSTQDGSVSKVREGKAGSMDSARISADGRFTAFSERVPDTAMNLNIVVARTDGGGEAKVAEDGDTNQPVVWLRSGGILFTCSRTGDSALWVQPMSEGKPRGAPTLIQSNLGHVEDLGSGPDGVVYLGRDASNHETYLVDYDPEARRVTTKPSLISRQHEGRHRAADWSGNGTQLAYIIGRASHDLIEGSDVIALRSVSDGREHRIVPRVAVLNFISSYDGRSLLIEGIDDRQRYGVFRVDTQTGESTPIIIGDQRQALIQPIWVSADDEILFYRKWDAATRQVTMMRRDMPSGDERALFSVPIPNSIHVAPGGDRFSIRRDGPVPGISVVDISSGTEKSIYNAPSADQIVDMKWMEDGHSILFFTRPRLARQSATETLYRIQVDGGSAVKLLEVPNRTDTDHWMRVRPDNRQILHTVTEQHLELWSLENYEPKQ